MDDDARFALGMPSALLVEITSLCNLKCRMCPLTARLTPSGAQPGHMPEEIWRRLVPFATGIRQVMIGGYGEPFASSNCIARLRELDALGVPTSLTTNGTLVTDPVAADLASLAHFTGVNVSIDSPDAAVYHEIRGGQLHRACEGARRLAAALGPEKVTVSSVMMQTTIGTLAAFPPLLARLGVKKYVLQGLIDYTRDVESEELRRRNGLAERIASIRRACDEAGVELSFALPDRVATELGEAGGRLLAGTTAETREPDTKQCTAPWELPVVDKDGRVFPCCYALSNSTAVLGDLRESSPESIWFGTEYERFRHDLLDGRTTPAVCRSCTVVPSGRHPLARYSARILGQPTFPTGGRMRLLVRNMGNAAWTERDQILIGTADPRDRPSTLFHPSWIGLNRMTSFVEPSVEPGGVATFEADVARPGDAAIETFQMVVEGQCWVPGTRFRLAPPATLAGGPASPVARRGKNLLRRLFGRAHT